MHKASSLDKLRLTLICTCISSPCPIQDSQGESPLAFDRCLDPGETRTTADRLVYAGLQLGPRHCTMTDALHSSDASWATTDHMLSKMSGTYGRS